MSSRTARYTEKAWKKQQTKKQNKNKSWCCGSVVRHYGGKDWSSALPSWGWRICKTEKTSNAGYKEVVLCKLTTTDKRGWGGEKTQTLSWASTPCTILATRKADRRGSHIPSLPRLQSKHLSAMRSGVHWSSGVPSLHAQSPLFALGTTHTISKARKRKVIDSLYRYKLINKQW